MCPNMMLFWIKHCTVKDVLTHYEVVMLYREVWEGYFIKNFFEKRKFFFFQICDFLRDNYQFMGNYSNTEYFITYHDH